MELRWEPGPLCSGGLALWGPGAYCPPQPPPERSARGSPAGTARPGRTSQLRGGRPGPAASRVISRQSAWH